jgi:sporulation protein YlmC with PRC-barrel domain
MLLLSNDLLTKQVLSLRTNQAVALIKDVIINPTNLKIEGFYCQDSRDKSQLILLGQDIRETIKDGYIINDHDVLAKAEDLIRLKEVLNINFSLIGKPVETVSGSKVGKVQDYSAELGSLFIQKIYVSQPLYKSLNGGNLAIDRTQINEITPKRIVIYDLMGSVPAQAKAGII